MSLIEGLETCCLSFKAEFNSRVAVEGSLAVRDKAPDGVRVSQVSVLLFVLGDEVRSVVPTLSLFLPGEVISSHL